MKKIIYSLVIMITASSLFTSCLEFIEPIGIQQLRTEKADYLNALAQLRLAAAELQEANAAYVLARDAYIDAMTEAQLIENRIREYDIQIKAAQTQFDIDSLAREKELLMIQYDEMVADAKANLAEAEENLRVTLRAIAAVQHLLTGEERGLLFAVMMEYEDAFDEYNDLLYELGEANARLWELEYALNDSTDWKVNFQGEVDFFAGEVERAKTALANVPENLDLEDWKSEFDMLQDSLNAIDYSAAQLSRDSVLYMVNTWCEANIGYEEEWQAAKEKYLADVAAVPVKPNPGDKRPPDPGAEPVRSDYDGKGDHTDSLALPELKVTTLQFDGTNVYRQFAGLVNLYANTAAPVGVDSTTNFFWAAGDPSVGYKAGIETNSTLEMVNFIFGKENTEEPLTFTYKDLANDTDVTLEDPLFIGLYGAHSVLNRHLVLTPSDKTALEKARQAAHDADSIYWAHRAILAAGRDKWVPEVDSTALADTLAKGIAYRQAIIDAKAQAQALIDAAKVLTGDNVIGAGIIAKYSSVYGASSPPPKPSAEVPPQDTTDLLAAIVDFAVKRWDFFDDANAMYNEPYNFLVCKNKNNNQDFRVDLRDIQRAGYQQKIGTWPTYKVYSDYSYGRYCT